MPVVLVLGKYYNTTTETKKKKKKGIYNKKMKMW